MLIELLTEIPHLAWSSCLGRPPFVLRKQCSTSSCSATTTTLAYGGSSRLSVTQSPAGCGFRKIVFTRQAQKDAQKLAAAGLKPGAEQLLKLLQTSPFQDLPPFERLVGGLARSYSRRINIQTLPFLSTDGTEPGWCCNRRFLLLHDCPWPLSTPARDRLLPHHSLSVRA